METIYHIINAINEHLMKYDYKRNKKYKKMTSGKQFTQNSKKMTCVKLNERITCDKKCGYLLKQIYYL